MTGYRRTRPSSFDPSPETKAFAGVQHRKATAGQTERATRNMVRNRRDQQLLGPVDPDREEDED